jgi:hypothetical protein
LGRREGHGRDYPGMRLAPAEPLGGPFGGAAPHVGPRLEGRRRDRCRHHRAQCALTPLGLQFGVGQRLRWRPAGFGLVGGGTGAGADVVVAGGASGSRSGTLSNHRSPAGVRRRGACELVSFVGRDPRARSATSPASTIT